MKKNNATKLKYKMKNKKIFSPISGTFLCKIRYAAVFRIILYTFLSIKLFYVYILRNYSGQYHISEYYSQFWLFMEYPLGVYSLCNISHDETFINEANYTYISLETFN